MLARAGQTAIAGLVGFGVVLAGCGLRPAQTREPILPELESPEPVITYNSRVVALRTSLGRAAITLELRGVATDVIRGTACDEPEGERLQASCARCELVGEGDPLDSAVLDATLAAFDSYPADILDATHIERVALCKSLLYENRPSEGIAGTVDLRARRLLINVGPFLYRVYDAAGDLTADDIVHHELFHLFEYERMRDAFDDDPEWRLNNPIGFVYDPAGEREPRKASFINAYASTNELEDRASVFQYLLARPGELCAIAADDAALRHKTRLVWRRVAAIAGDGFLRERASCVLPWLDAVETDTR